jgi:hypothetical protein
VTTPPPSIGPATLRRPTGFGPWVRYERLARNIGLNVERGVSRPTAAMVLACAEALGLESSDAPWIAAGLTPPDVEAIAAEPPNWGAIRELDEAGSETAPAFVHVLLEKP